MSSLNEGKECRVRQHLRSVIDELRRSGDRMEVDGLRPLPEQLAMRIMAMARVAVSVHLAQATANQIRWHEVEQGGRAQESMR